MSFFQTVWNAMSAKNNSGDLNNKFFASIGDSLNEHFVKHIPQDLITGPFQHINDPVHVGNRFVDDFSPLAILFVLGLVVALAYGAYTTETGKSPQKKSD
jgi:hypothetical protein